MAKAAQGPTKVAGAKVAGAEAEETGRAVAELAEPEAGRRVPA